MILIKFYPSPEDFTLGRDAKYRLRKIADDLLLDLQHNYKVIIEERFGSQGGGQYYELDKIGMIDLLEYLAEKEEVFSTQKKILTFQGDTFPDSVLIRIG